MIEAGKIPITQVEAKPPKARNPAEIKALMSRVEKENSYRSIEERRTKPSPEFRDTSEGGDGFVVGEIDISVESAVDWVPNHGIEIPADVRVFAPSMLDMVMRGKYQRKLARLTEWVVQNGERLLDLGSGVDFLSMYACKLHEGTHVLAQEDNTSRRVIADSILERSALDFVAGLSSQTSE